MTPRTLALCIPLLFPCTVSTVFAQDAADLQRARDEAIADRAERIDKDVKQIDGEYDLQDLFSIRLDERGWIKLTPKLPDKLGPMNRLKVRGFPNPVRLDVERDEDQSIAELRVVVTNYSHAHAVVVESQIHWSPEVMVVDQMARYLSGQNYVALIQQDTAPDDKKLPRGVIFRIMLGDIPGQSAADSLEAKSFAELRQNHWNAVEQHLRPILHELRLTSVLSVDPKLAWQVFAAEWEPDPKAVRQLAELLPALNAEDFKERRAAVQKLKEIGDPVIPAILKLDRKQLTPEQSTGLDSVLASLLKPDDELTKLRTDANFLADCLYTSDERILRAALNHINKLLDKETKLDPATTTDQRAPIVEPLRRELTTRLAPPAQPSN